MRARDHGEGERVIFRIFLEANAMLATDVVRFEKIPDEFPDIAAYLRDGTRLTFELREWLDIQQMMQMKGVERLEGKVLAAVGEQGRNQLRHIQFVSLQLSDKILAFEEGDAAAFRREHFELIHETDRRFPEERGWHARAYHSEGEFRRYQTLKKYLRQVLFSHVIDGRGLHRKRFPAGRWITMRPWGGSYDPKDALAALRESLTAKLSKYSPSAANGVRLIVYYDKAFMYNTPFWGPETNKFGDVAAMAARSLAGVSVPFARVYLLNALQPGAEAFEIFPDFVPLMPERRKRDSRRASHPGRGTGADGPPRTTGRRGGRALGQHVAPGGLGPGAGDPRRPRRGRRHLPRP